MATAVLVKSLVSNGTVFACLHLWLLNKDYWQLKGAVLFRRVLQLFIQASVHTSVNLTTVANQPVAVERPEIVLGPRLTSRVYEDRRAEFREICTPEGMNNAHLRQIVLINICRVRNR